MPPRILLTRRERRVRPSWPPLRRVLERILEDHDVAGTLSVVFVSDSEIGRLHGEFLGDDRPTDVLSFGLGDDPAAAAAEAAFGEVIVSTETARREAARRRLPVAREVALYAIHGTLHLMGFDDLDPVKRREMKRQERRYIDLYRELGGE